MSQADDWLVCGQISRQHCLVKINGEGRRLLKAFELGHYWDTQVLGLSQALCEPQPAR